MSWHGINDLRLDLFLKISRLVKRRTLAHEFCQRGWIEVNGVKGKPGKDVSPGDKIILHLGSRRKEIEILHIPQGNVSAKDANTLYRVISDTPMMEGR
jgi:ribosomal 50S subunit-recycling heat shock protein